jgi:hypothetical protein
VEIKLEKKGKENEGSFAIKGTKNGFQTCKITFKNGKGSCRTKMNVNTGYHQVAIKWTGKSPLFYDKKVPVIVDEDLLCPINGKGVFEPKKIIRFKKIWDRKSCN